jgi:acyl-CoA thioesterase I
VWHIYIKTLYHTLQNIKNKKREGFMAQLRLISSANFSNVSAQERTPLETKSLGVVAFGDSLTAGYGLAQSDSLPAVLSQALISDFPTLRLLNAGVSGDTTQNGRDRLAWSIPEDTKAVLLALGANDALRGLSPSVARANLEAMIQALQARKIVVFLIGMRAPPNLGEDYVRAFDGLYAELAKLYNLPLYPFLLEGVAGNPALNLPDGIHPNRLGIQKIVEKLSPPLKVFLRSLEK